MSAQDELVAALDNHQVTDDEGELVEETTTEEPTTQEQTPEEEDATAEKSEKSEDKSTQEESKEDENEPELVETASDETGKRYVPETRFKEVYARMKAAERAAKSKPAEVSRPQAPVTARKPVDKLDSLEIETLRSTLPQFNPESNDYSREIDELGYSIYEGSKDTKGNYTMTRIEAGRKAISMAKKITSKVAEVKSEAKTVKAQQSDQGITSRVLNRESTQIDPEKMSLEEKEEWLKANGYW